MSQRKRRPRLPSSTESAILAMDDPVPFGSCVATVEPGCAEEQPHAIEQKVQRRLLGSPHLRFSSLVVRRMADGVCLEGVVDTDADSVDVCRLVQQVPGVERVINRLLVRHCEGLDFESAPAPEDCPHQG